MKLDCPACTKSFTVGTDDPWGATMDCAHCGVLLIADPKKRAIRTFQSYMDEAEPAHAGAKWHSMDIATGEIK